MTETSTPAGTGGAPGAPGTVLFDMFGVIARVQSPSGKARLLETAGVTGVRRAAFWEAYWSLRPPYDRGQVAGPGYWDLVARALGTRFDAERTAALVEADVASWSAVDAEMVALVAGLAAAGRTVALLSNIPEELAVHYERHHPWLAHFRVRSLSCRTGHAKPDPAAYEGCLRELGADAASVLFVDDREENVRAARALGMRGHVFTSAADLRTALGTS
ncbi:HAD family phosphatase [Streptomyces racemochromogenes]|uniref:HAD family phosphatase n=1 Tax=Streptomyces racemochromogenes TaxID=67353 RepID=A0ABW7PGN3_9ACTN